MARETKIGLLVGLGVIIFIGILVSDHLSLAQRQGFTGLTATAEGGPVPTHHQRQGYTPPVVQRDQPLPDPGLTRTDDTAHTDNGSSRNVDLPYEIYRVDRSRTGNGQPQAQHQQPEPDVLVIRAEDPDAGSAQPGPRLADQVHHVQPGETLSAIAEKHYGDRNYWRTIYDANRDRIPSQNVLRVGVRLVIPKRGGAAVQQAAATERTSAQPAASGYREYTIAPGDSLSVLAQKFMGSQRHTHKLYELNRSVIRDPDSLIVGTVIRIPAQ
jgi:LysM repeat protein